MQAKEPMEPLCLLLLGPFSGIFGKSLSEWAQVIVCSELSEFVCSYLSGWKIGVREIPDYGEI